MELGKDFRKIFYGGGAIAILLSILLIGRTLISAVPIVGFARCVPHLVMSVFFLLVGVALVLVARKDAKKEAAKLAAEEQDQQ
ncbi:MAG: hypothetical protein J6K94_02585 [Ruminiclostridium sp.]|nr:hypothetical protein [Ruminiclostridium sp.]